MTLPTSPKSISSTSEHHFSITLTTGAANADPQPSLTQSDRDVLQNTASRIGTYAAVGSALGLGAGLFLALRLRRARKQIFDTIRASERPTHLQFANGRTEPLPDLTPYMKPTTLGDFATYTFFGAGGLFLFGELGIVIGSYSGKRTIMKDPESRKRIEIAFRKFRADMLRKEIEELEKGTGSKLERATGGLLS